MKCEVGSLTFILHPLTFNLPLRGSKLHPSSFLPFLVPPAKFSFCYCCYSNAALVLDLLVGNLVIAVKLTRLLLWLVAVVFIVTLSGCQTLYGSAKYPVKRVSDGDTLTVVDPKGSDIHVRFACVDAPEIPHSAKERESNRARDRNQFRWGIEAQERLQQLIHQGGDRVNLTITDSDRYGRQVAEVYLRDRTLVQEVLAREGLVLVFNQYLKNCPDATMVQQAQALAQQEQRGVWSDPKFVPPWKYRSAKR